MFIPGMRQVIWFGFFIMWTLLVMLSHHVGLPLGAAPNNAGNPLQVGALSAPAPSPLATRGLLIGEQDKVLQVVPGSAADLTDVRVGDIVVALNDAPVGATVVAQLNASIAAEQRVVLTLRRPGHTASIVATLADPAAGPINP